MSHFNYDELRFGDQTTSQLSTSRWDALVGQVQQLEGTVNRIYLGEPNGAFAGRMGIGTSTPQGKLQIVHRPEDANGGALILGPTNTANLRLGYHTTYSWIQSHGTKPLAINPKGNKVGIGTTAPQSSLHVHGRIQSSKDGFRFPDGSIQTSASQVTHMQSGKERMNRTGSWKTSPLAIGKTYTTGKIELRGFAAKPHILHSFYRFDCDNDSHIRIKIETIYVSKTSFRFRFTTWSKTKVYYCELNWLAIGIKA